MRLGQRYNAWMYRVRGEVFDRVVGKWATNGGMDVLEVGAGTGFYVERWLRRGARVVGVDITDVAVEHLARSFPPPQARFLRADIGGSLEGVPLRKGSFHAVSALDVLFHIVDDAAYASAFQNIATLLRPGGWFFWSDNFLRHERAAPLPPHQASRPLEESRRLVEAAGFEIVERVPMFVLMNYPADTRSRLLRWSWTAMVAPAMIAEPFGWLVGAALYPMERALVKRLRESPSTELMVCRKRRT